MGQSIIEPVREVKELNRDIYDFKDFKFQVFNERKDDEFFIATIWGTEICFNMDDMDNLFINKKSLIKFLINSKMEFYEST